MTNKAIIIPSGGLLRRSRHAVAPRSASVPAIIALLFVAGSALSVVFFLGGGPSFEWHITSLFRDHDDDVTAPRGRWVREEDPGARPYYTNATCAFIEDYQNCMKHGRPSLEFLRWRWRPATSSSGSGSAVLPDFDAARFLGLVRGKSMLFVGDSLASSHVRSLVCTLSSQADQGGAPVVMETLAGGFERWRFPAHDFAVVFFWTPFLVRWRLTRGPAEAVGPDRQGEVFAGPSDLHLDEPDERWTSAVRDHDYVVVSASHWFARPAVYYYSNLTAQQKLKPQRAAFRTVLRALAAGAKGGSTTTTAILRTVAPTHYENGGWFDGGECTATRPADPEDPVEMAEAEAEFYRAQVEEFKAAEVAAKRNGVRLRLMDVTGMMLRRPDGHPDRYGHGHGPGEEHHQGFDIDCLHWCLPGPIDAWNQLLLRILVRT